MFVEGEAPAKNDAFWKAVGILSKPVSLGAIGALLVNDHVLRRLWPSWLTGKIGDLAWLFFFPFVLAAVLAWLLPPRGRRQAKIVGGLAFGSTGAVFALANTVPVFHAWVVRWLEGPLGGAVSLTRDVTDLMALVALLPGWWLWQRERGRPRELKAPGWILLPLAASLTMANSAAENYGIDCLAVQDERVMAYTSFEIFSSTDGGLLWEQQSLQADSRCPRGDGGSGFSESDPDFRIWQEEADFASASQAERAFYERTRGGSIFFEPGPLDSATDPGTGNVIYAMGHEGVLVRTPGAQWRWAPVGTYRRVKLNQISSLFDLLYGEGILAFSFGLLCIGTLALVLSRSCFRIASLAVGWGLWLAALVLLPPALTTGYVGIVAVMFLFFVALVNLGIAVLALFRFYQLASKVLLAGIVVGLVGEGLFFLPYVVWALGGVANYHAAVLFALMLGAVVLFAGERWFRRVLTRWHNQDQPVNPEIPSHASR